MVWTAARKVCKKLQHTSKLLSRKLHDEKQGGGGGGGCERQCERERHQHFLSVICTYKLSTSSVIERYFGISAASYSKSSRITHTGKSLRTGDTIRLSLTISAFSTSYCRSAHCFSKLPLFICSCVLFMYPHLNSS